MSPKPSTYYVSGLYSEFHATLDFRLPQTKQNR